jgi:hypothetical protein
MKKLITLILLAVTFFGTKAQSNKEDIDIIQSVFGKQKKEIVDAYMQLAPEKAKSFWAVYDAFENERKALGRARIQILDEYAAGMDKLTNEMATNLMKRTIANETALSKLYGKYLPKFTKATSAIDAAKFLQLEFYIQSIVKARIQDEVPLIGALDGSLKK